ncbi:hypothetical protein KAURM247S_00180 [Kitasatospora aureofaciens]
MISSAGRSPSASSRSASRPPRSPSMIRRCSLSSSGSAASSCALEALTEAVETFFEQLQQALQRVVAVPAAVVHQVEGGLALVLGDPGDRQDLGGVHDRRVQAGLHALVQEDRVEHHAGGRVEAEGDVRQAEGGLHPRVAALELADRLDRLDAVPAGLLLAGGQGEGEAVDQDRALVDAVVGGQLGDQPLGDLHLLLGRTGLALLVDGQRDQAGAVLAGQRRDPAEARVGGVAVLVVDRVEHRAAAERLQAGLQHRRFGGVQHDRQGGGGGQPAGDLLHVGDAVAADVVHAQVQQVRAVPDLVPGDLHAGLPVAGQHRLAELLRAVGVGALADRQVRGVLAERHRLVERGGRGLRLGVAPGDRAALDLLHHLAQVLGRGAAAAADQREPVLAGEHVVRLGQFGRGERVVGTVLAEHRQARVRHAGQADPRVLGQVAQVLAHLGRAGGAVEADEVDAERLQRGERGADLGAEQHGAGGLHRHLHQHREVQPGLGQGALGTQDRGLGLQQVLAGLHQQRVGATGDQAGRVLLEAVAQRLVRGVAEGRQLGAGADRAEHPAGAAVGGVGVGHLAGDPGAGLGELEDPLGDVVLAQRGEVGAEGVGLDAVHAHREVGLVHGADDVRPGDVEDLVAALEVLEVLQRRVLRLEHGAHRTVGDHHPGGECFAQRVRAALLSDGRVGCSGHGASPWCDGCRLCEPASSGPHAARVSGPRAATRAHSVS